MSEAVSRLLEHLEEADQRHVKASARLLETFQNIGAGAATNVFPSREHRRQLIADWQQLGGFGRLRAAGWQDKHSMVGLIEVRCKPHQGAVIIEKRKLQIRAHRPLRDRTRLIATLPAPSLLPPL